MVIDGVLRSPLLFVLVVLPLCCCFECLHSPRVTTLEKSPFRHTRASDVGAALPCLRPGFIILASRQSMRQIEASIDRGQSSRTHATGHAVESPSGLRWQPRIIVRYSRGPQPRRNTKWRRPHYTLKLFLKLLGLFKHHTNILVGTNVLDCACAKSWGYQYVQQGVLCTAKKGG